MTAGIPGTGVFYTSYSRSHARAATRTQVHSVGGVTPSSPLTASHKEPMLPRTKVILGIGLIWLPPVGLIILIVGLVQRNQPLWVARTLVAKARRTPSQTLELLHQAATLLPNNAEVLGPLAEYRFSQQQWTEAAQTFEQYLLLAPTDLVALGHCGLACLNGADYDGAITHLTQLRESAALTPDSHASASAHLALAFLHKGDSEQAVAIAKQENLRVRTLGDGGQQCLYVRAVGQYIAGSHAAAISDLDRLYAMNPTFDGLVAAKAAMAAGTFALG